MRFGKFIRFLHYNLLYIKCTMHGSDIKGFIAKLLICSHGLSGLGCMGWVEGSKNSFIQKVIVFLLEGLEEMGTSCRE